MSEQDKTKPDFSNRRLLKHLYIVATIIVICFTCIEVSITKAPSCKGFCTLFLLGLLWLCLVVLFDFAFIGDICRNKFKCPIGKACFMKSFCKDKKYMEHLNEQANDTEPAEKKTDADN